MRFAHLTLRGEPVLVDPRLVGVVMKEQIEATPASQRMTAVYPREPYPNDAPITYCDEDPAEAGRRIVAAAGGATAADVEDAIAEFTMDVVRLLDTRSTSHTKPYEATDLRDLKSAIRAHLHDAFAKLKKTVLAAAYAAEGKET